MNYIFIFIPNSYNKFHYLSYAEETVQVNLVN